MLPLCFVDWCTNMSEFLNHLPERSSQLLEYSQRLIAGENGKMLFEIYRPVFETVKAEEVMEALDGLLQLDLPFDSVKGAVGKIMNACHATLQTDSLHNNDLPAFLKALSDENRWVEGQMKTIKTLVRGLALEAAEMFDEKISELRELIRLLRDYELHYLKKEHILFPYLEKRVPAYRCIQLMWAFHDDFRKSLKQLELQLMEKPVKIASVHQELGRLFFVVLPILFREEKVLFPVAMRYVEQAEWEQMLHESLEIGWCGNVKIVLPDLGRPIQAEGSLPSLVDLSTGSLSGEQLVWMLESLPIDITYIDENDEVRYFSGAKHRIFPRSKAIIGRKVQNCHPKSSLQMVNEIVEAFRKGDRDSAEFWIQMRGMFVHIRYFALRNEFGDYKGSIEVSQEVSGIRKLEGERRLLQWE